MCPVADGYRIFRSTDGVDFLQVGEVRDPNATTWVNATGLTHGTKYWYRVRAFSDAAGNSQSTYKYSEVTPMPPPTDLTISEIRDGSMKLAWTDNASAEASYVILRYSSAGELQTWYELPANTTSYTVDDLEENTTYQWRVYAYNDVCDSMSTLMQTATTLPFQPPSNLRLKVDGMYGLAAWWEDHSDVETGYELSWTNPGQSSQTITVSANQTNVILPGASADATVSIQAVSGGTSSSSVSPVKRSGYVYLDDFNNPVQGFADAEWSGGTLLETSWTTDILGMFDNGTVSLNLSELPAHSKLQAAFTLVVLPGENESENLNFTFGLAGEETARTNVGPAGGGDLDVDGLAPGREYYYFRTADNNDIHLTHHGDEATLNFKFQGLASDTRWAVAGVTIYCDTPVAWIEAVYDRDYAIEGKPPGDPREKAQFALKRNFGTFSQGVSIKLKTLGGETTAAADDYPSIPEQNGIEAGQSEKIIEVKPNDDDTPEWTETLTLGIEPDADRFFVKPGFEKAKVEIVDNDLKIEGLPSKLRTNSDDDNHDGWADITLLDLRNLQGENDLYELSFMYPPLKPGATLTLRSAGKIRVWEKPTRGELLASGMDGVNTPSLVVWDIQHPPPQHVYVECFIPSEAIDDVTITLESQEQAGALNPQHPTATSVTKRATIIPDVWIVDHHDAIEGPSDPTIGFEIHRAGLLSAALTVALDGFEGTAEPDEHYRALMVVNEINIPANASSSGVISMSTIDNSEVEMSRTVEMRLESSGDDYQLVNGYFKDKSFRNRQRRKLGVARVYIDDDERGPIAGRSYPVSRAMNPKDQDDYLGDASNTSVNCYIWAMNDGKGDFDDGAPDFEQAIGYAAQHRLLWNQYLTLDDALVDAAMMQRVLEAMLYDSGAGHPQGYRMPNQDAAPNGWHKIRAYHKTYLTAPNDYHFAAEGYDVAMATWTWQQKNGWTIPVWLAGGPGDDYFCEYAINTPPRHKVSGPPVEPPFP